MKPVTEEANPKTKDIDLKSSIEIVRLINEEDRTIAESVSKVLDRVAAAIDAIVERLSAGGRLFYIGTGTSGRLGVLDASECPPTFGVSPDTVQGIIAGGYEALHKAVEAAEDDPRQAALDIEQAGVNSRDAVVGISASGNTPYTLGALSHARQIGALAIALTCNPASRMAAEADISIAVEVGPEVIAGSSRMKAGTAQKMILNMLTTGAMIRLGLVYGNLMSNLRATNAKLHARARAILAQEAGLETDEAARIFEESGRNLRIAIVMARAHVERDEAKRLLADHNNSVRRALDSLNR